ncbi:PAS domain S-box protein [Streptomyces sp. NPDC059680]|uniref:PAS domain S-box protein n=1 Tax=Streptomyces sp. NPDC059680 TaxID=3346904 RepID=UPI0036928D6D
MTASAEGGHVQETRFRELEAALDAINDYSIITLDVDGRVTSWNHGSEAIRGFTANDAIGKPISMFYPPEERASGAVERELQMARESGRAEFEGWRVRADGSLFWANVVLVPIRDSANNLTGYVKAARDITAQRQTESLFQGLMESSPDAMLIITSQGRIELANQQAEHLFGYIREELVGQEVEALIPHRLRRRHPVYRADYMKAPSVRAMGEGLDLWALRRDGSEFPVEIRLSPLDTPSQGRMVAAAIRDVTKNEQRLSNQRDEILELSIPVLQIWDKILALPIIGTLDSVRAARLTESLLTEIDELAAEVIIIDISGVPTIDTLVAQHLMQTAQAANLMGATSILCGVRPETAQAIVHLGLDMGRLRSRTTLRSALQLAMQMLSGKVGSSVPETEASNGGLA